MNGNLGVFGTGKMPLTVVSGHSEPDSEDIFGKQSKVKRQPQNTCIM